METRGEFVAQRCQMGT